MKITDDFFDDDPWDYRAAAFQKALLDLENYNKEFEADLREKREEYFSDKKYYDAILEAREIVKREGLDKKINYKSFRPSFDFRQAITAACLAREDTAAIKIAQEEILQRLTLLDIGKLSLARENDRLRLKIDRLHLMTILVSALLLIILIFK